MSIRQHEREVLVNAAMAKAWSALVDATEGLTEGEKLRVVNECCSDWIAGVAKFAIREERHGNQDTPGGLATDAKPTREELDAANCGNIWAECGLCRRPLEYIGKRRWRCNTPECPFIQEHGAPPTGSADQETKR